MRPLIILFLLVSYPLLSQKSLVPAYYSKAYKDPLYMILEADSITAVLEHVETAGKFVVFDLELVNRSGQPIDFNPFTMHYYAGPKQFPGLNEESQDIHQTSFPNSTVPGYLKKSLSKKAVESEYQRQLKQQKNLAIAFGILSLGAVVADVALDIDDSQKNFFSERDVNRAINRDALVATTLLAGEIVMENAALRSMEASEGLYTVEKEVLEPVTLADNAAVRGKVFFENTGHYKFYRIVVPVGELNYVFDFRKRRASEY